MKTIRIPAFLLAALMLLALLSGCGKQDGAQPAGEKPSGLFYEASGIDPKATIAAVNGREISAEEYLYWLAYHCESILADRGGSVKWDEVISDDITYGEYARRSALATVIQFSVARDFSEKYHVGLTDADRAQLQKKKEDDVLRWGGREGYLRYLERIGVSEETYDRIDENYVLTNRLVETAGVEGSDLYPSQETLDNFMKGKDYATVRLIVLPVAGMSDEEKAAQRDMLAQCARQIREAEDPAAKLAEIARSLGLSDGDRDQTLASNAVDITLMQAVRELETGEVSDVVETNVAMCVALRRPLDKSAIARECFSAYLVQARQNAKVEISDSYKNLNVGTFYTSLEELRKTMFDDDVVKQ